MFSKRKRTVSQRDYMDYLRSEYPQEYRRLRKELDVPHIIGMRYFW